MSTPENPQFVPASKLIALFAYIRERGIDADQFINAIESDPDAWRDPETSIPLDLWLALNRRAAAQLDDPDFGLGFGTFFWGMPTMLGHLLAACRDVGEALEKFSRYQGIEHHSWRVESRMAGTSLELLFVPSNPLTRDRLIVDFVLANIVNITMRLTGVAIKPESVNFAYQTPLQTSEYRKIFACPVHFGCQENMIVVPSSCLSIPIRTASEAVRKQLEEPLDRALKVDLVDRRFTGLVTEAIARRRGGKAVDEISVAREIGIGVRDLQLKLKTEGTTFLALRDSFQRTMALEYLGDKTLGLKEIAFLLGFSEASAFHRAFVRWTGKTPGEVRSAGENQ